MDIDYNDNRSSSNQQRDIILSPNEFVFVQNSTNGIIRTYTGPMTLTISAQDYLVRFDVKTKQFYSVKNPQEAKQLFVSPPENWYVVLKNPTTNASFPEIGKASISPELRTGRKININGPTSFALYPGQMAKVIKGHSLRSNQYLLARVYEAESANNSEGEMLDAEGNKITSEKNYVNGQILVIKGTEVSFYIPPTGIEILPINNDTFNGYIREAVTLERLEYCILKDEDGNKRYVHGPEVVFPEPTEQFVSSPKGGLIFKAIELSPISGIYVKVIAEYTEDDVVHPVGEELFITGKDCMIYYPRPEHAIINYDGKIVHHAIAIPEGEGRYIMNRLTGKIDTVRGPAMYLPDPRTQVVVKRKLTASQCALWYPGNNDALAYNNSLNEKATEKNVSKAITMSLTNGTMASNSVTDSLAFLEANANISRGTSYTKPRTITLDNKYDGVVSIDVWTGYAVDVVSKNGNRKVVVGPCTILLDYDQTLEVLELSTGKPKSTDDVIKTVFLRHENNKISDIIKIETKDFVHGAIKLSYCVNFDNSYSDKWFNIDNYVKYLCDRERSLIKRLAKNYTIEEFYQNYVDLVRNLAIDKENGSEGRFFEENGMRVYDCEVLGLDIENEYEEMLNDHQTEIIRKGLQLSNATAQIKLTEELSRVEKLEHELESQKLIHRMNLQEVEAKRKLEIQNEVNRLKEAETLAEKQAEADMQVLIDEVHAAQMLREKKTKDAKLNYETRMANIEKAKQMAYAEAAVKIIEAISPDLTAAMNSKTNTETVAAIAKAISPYALAGDNETLSDVINKITRGTPLEEALSNIKKA
jgi:major vault protein